MTKQQVTDLFYALLVALVTGAINGAAAYLAAAVAMAATPGAPPFVLSMLTFKILLGAALAGGIINASAALKAPPPIRQDPGLQSGPQNQLPQANPQPNPPNPPQHPLQ